MEYFLQLGGTIAVIITVLALMGIGLAGCVIPMLPGHILIFAAALVMEWGTSIDIAWYNWCILAVLCILGMTGDSLLSLWGARRFGSTKAGLAGCFAGIIVGVFLPPWGLLFGPFAGALLAELIFSRQDIAGSLKSGTGALLGTLAGYIFKTGIGLAMIGLLAALYTMSVIS